MGQCSCCPSLLSRQKSSDSLSVYTTHPSIESQIPPDKGKPSKKTELKSMVRQESAYFNRANKLKLGKQVITTNKIPLITPTDQPLLEPGNRSDFSFRLKERIKPHINKVSTADQEGSFHNRQFVRKNRMSEQHSESFEQPPQNQKAVKENCTFDFGSDSIVLAIQFRSLPSKTEVVDCERLTLLKDKLEEVGITVLQQAQTLFQLSKIYFQSKDYNECLSYITKIPPLFAQLPSHLFKFGVISMLGCCQLLLAKPDEAVQTLLKGVRMEVAESGIESIRLVQLYYWLGEAYLRLGKSIQAKQYLTKSLRGYRTHQLDDEQLLIAIYLQTGVYYSRQQQLVEAQKYFQKGLKLHSSTHSAHFAELLLRRAENYLSLQHYKDCMRHFSLFFSFLRKHNANSCPLWEQGQECLKTALEQIRKACISDVELAAVIGSADECMCEEELVRLLKERLKKMRNILYKT